MRDCTFLHSPPAFCGAENLENQASGSLVQLDEIKSYTTNNYQTVVTVLQQIQQLIPYNVGDEVEFIRIFVISYLGKSKLLSKVWC